MEEHHGRLRKLEVNWKMSDQKIWSDPNCEFNTLEIGNVRKRR